MIGERRSLSIYYEAKEVNARARTTDGEGVPDGRWGCRAWVSEQPPLLTCEGGPTSDAMAEEGE